MSYKTQTTSNPSEVIVDLSRHWQKLSQYHDISDDLTDEEELKLVDYLRACGQMSYDRISPRHTEWQKADEAHDVYVDPHATNFREKAVISDTRAVADTVLTYQMAALAGRNPMFQLEGLSRQSKKPALILERLLHQHMRRTAGEARIAQVLLDSIRYGYAPTKVVWDANTRTNQTVNFDPRRAYTDPRVCWGDWERMQFMIFTDTVSTSALLSSGQYPKIRKYPVLRQPNTNTRDGWDIHRWAKTAGKGFNINPTTPTHSESQFTLGAARIIDEMWVRFSGFEIGLPGIENIWMVLACLDEYAIVRFQLNPNGKQFPTVIGGLYFDSHKSYSQSLYDLLLPMHDIATWLMRSRIDNVQAALNNLIFVDPTQVNIADLIDRNPWGVVQTLPGTNPGDGVFIAEVPDITRGHWNDIAAMSDLKQRVAAASDAQQGMPTSDGIRSATEIQRLTQLGSQRLGVIARIVSATTIRPAVRMQVANIQDALSYEGSIRMPSETTPGALTNMIEDDYLDFDVSMLQGDIDYLVVDGTLPIEPTRNANTWMTILGTVRESGLQMEYKTGKMLEEAIRSMGVTDLEQFKISPEDAAGGLTPSQQMSMLEASRGETEQHQSQYIGYAEYLDNGEPVLLATKSRRQYAEFLHNYMMPVPDIARELMVPMTVVKEWLKK